MSGGARVERGRGQPGGWLAGGIAAEVKSRLNIVDVIGETCS